MRDGRFLAFAEYGVPDGRPVLFVPGAASGRSMAFGGDLLETEDVRLISFDRPGLGRSDNAPPHAPKTFASVAADAAELVEHLVGAPIPVVANSQGAPFGIAIALGGTASRLVLVSPSDEVAFPEVHAQLPDDVRSFVSAVGEATDPEALFTSFTPASFFEMVMSHPSPTDAAVYEDADFRERFRRAVEEAFAGGPAGYARDTALAMSPWGLDLAAVRVPVHILFGAEDESHSPDRGEALAARFGRAVRSVVPGAGGSLLWADPRRVLQAVFG